MDVGKAKSMIPVETIERRIYLIRHQKVMLDNDLAQLYGVKTKELNKAIGRNKERFPKDFVFHLTQSETDSLRFQFGTSKLGRGGRRYRPYAFTEHGVAMLSSVLRSKRAAQVNVAIMRAFIRLRRLMATDQELAGRLSELERKTKRHDSEIRGVIAAIRELIKPQTNHPPKKIGFEP